MTTENFDMNDAVLRAQIQRAKTICCPHDQRMKGLLWTLATELEKRMPPAPIPSGEVTDCAPHWEAHRGPLPDWSAA